MCALSASVPYAKERAKSTLYGARNVIANCQCSGSINCREPTYVCDVEHCPKVTFYACTRPTEHSIKSDISYVHCRARLGLIISSGRKTYGEE